MRRVAAGLVAALLAATGLQAQESTTTGAFELRPVVGVFVPTFAMRNDFRDAMLVGAQGGFEFAPNIHLLLGGFWVRDSSHVGSLGSRRAEIWQFEAGVETNSIRGLAHHWLLRPFVGGGLGLRAIDYSAADGSSRCFAAYGSGGVEFQRYNGSIRLDARDYVSCFEPPVTRKRKTGNDVGLTVGLAYHAR